MGFGGIFLAFEQDRLGFGGDAALLRGGPGRVRGVGLGRRVAAEGYAGDPAGDSAEFQIDPVDPFLQRKNQRNVEMIDAAVERLGLPGRRMDRQGIDFVVEAVELVILGIVRPNRGESDFAAVRKGVFPADFQGKGHVLGGFLGDDIGKGEDIPPRRRTVHIEGEPGAFADLQEGDGSSLRSGALGQGDAGRLLRQADILRRNGEGLIRGNQAFQPAAGRMVIGGDGVRCQRPPGAFRTEGARRRQPLPPLWRLRPPGRSECADARRTPPYRNGPGCPLAGGQPGGCPGSGMYQPVTSFQAISVVELMVSSRLFARSAAVLEPV